MMKQWNRPTVVLTAVLAGASAMIAAQQTQQKGGGDEFGPYQLVENWPQNPCGPGYQQ